MLPLDLRRRTRITTTARKMTKPWWWRVQTRRIRGISVADYTEFYLHGREERTLANYRAACRLVGLHTDNKGRL